MVIRTDNLVVEVFVDVADDGTAFAEAMLLRSAERRLLARGSARFRPTDAHPDPVDDRWVVAEALVDLADTLLQEAGQQEAGSAADDGPQERQLRVA